MKKEVVFSILICILLVQILSAETTFFEGDYDYRENFIMADLPAEAIAEGAEILQQGWGGYFIRQAYNKTLICGTCFEDLREHIDKKKRIDYTEEEIILLADSINQDPLQVNLSNNQLRYILENFEEECNRPLPLLWGIAGGRFSDLFSPLVIAIAVIVLVFFIVIGYLIIKVLKKKVYGKTKKRKRKSKKNK